MKRPALAVIALSVATPCFGPAAFAQQTCAPRAEIVGKLAQEFKESQQAVGLVSDQAVIELYVSGKGTWTIIASGTDGTACVVSAGEGWEGANFVKGLDTGLHRSEAARPPAGLSAPILSAPIFSAH